MLLVEINCSIYNVIASHIATVIGQAVSALCDIYVFQFSALHVTVASYISSCDDFSAQLYSSFRKSKSSMTT